MFSRFLIMLIAVCECDKAIRFFNVNEELQNIKWNFFRAIQ